MRRQNSNTTVALPLPALVPWARGAAKPSGEKETGTWKEKMGDNKKKKMRGYRRVLGATCV